MLMVLLVPRAEKEEKMIIRQIAVLTLVLIVLNRLIQHPAAVEQVPEADPVAVSC